MTPFVKASVKVDNKNNAVQENNSVIKIPPKVNRKTNKDSEKSGFDKKMAKTFK